MYNPLFVLAILLAFSYTKAATTPMSVTPHPDKFEIENFRFMFDGTTGHMTVRYENNCYIWTLTPLEHRHIHTADGLRTVELRIMKQIEHAYFTVVPKSLIHPSLITSCYHASHFYLVH